MATENALTKADLDEFMDGYERKILDSVTKMLHEAVAPPSVVTPPADLTYHPNTKTYYSPGTDRAFSKAAGGRLTEISILQFQTLNRGV